MILECAVEAFAAAAGLWRIRGNVINAELRQRPADLREALFIDRALRLRRVEGPVRPIRVERHGYAFRPQDRRQTRHDGVGTFARVEGGVEHAFGRVIRHGDQTRALRRREGEPGVHTAIEMQQLAKAGARLTTQAMAPAGPPFLDEAGHL